MFTGANANGKKLPPLVVFKGKFVWDQWMAELVGGDYDFELSYAASTKGWIETDIFYNYIEKVLIPSLGEERPVLIVYNGHSTHVHVEWQRRNVGTKMPKKVFAQALADTWRETNPNIIKGGFRKAGIFPFNAHVIPVDKYDPDAYKRYQKKTLEEHFASTQPTPKNPKSLQEICIGLFNNQLATTNDALENANTNDVTLL
ncbi:unnamed protein product [Parnassius apollo]|uniref:(apollo) hypothetical protein n=1 Tax=Parnassius apollo TaxID=110799 RepID=A0A8S3WE02_PARAO|nr:unnamed protein product [Parnassius apollo]